eukprot:3755977-Rhodomonas_salina.2
MGREERVPGRGCGGRSRSRQGNGTRNAARGPAAARREGVGARDPAARGCNSKRGTSRDEKGGSMAVAPQITMGSSKCKANKDVHMNTCNGTLG